MHSFLSCQPLAETRMSNQITNVIFILLSRIPELLYIPFGIINQALYPEDHLVQTDTFDQSILKKRYDFTDRRFLRKSTDVIIDTS